MVPRKRPFPLIALTATLAFIVAACGSDIRTPTSSALDTPPASHIKVPNGFSVVQYAGGLDHPTSLAFAPDGRLFVALQDGTILSMADGDGNGIADETSVYAIELTLPLGMTFVGDDLVVSFRGTVVRVPDVDNDGAADGLEYILRGLPVGGSLHANHQNNGIALGTDGFLYIGIGIDPLAPESQTPIEAGPTSHPALGLLPTPETGEVTRLDGRAGTILRVRLDGSDVAIVATGFKNPVGLAFDAQGNLFATDIGPDNPEGPDELNFIVPGADYGYPRTGDGLPGPGDVPPVATLDVAATNGVVFYTADQFPEEFRNIAFVTQWGQALRDVPFTNRVVRIKIRPDGDRLSGTVRSFAVGFQHPIAIALGPDGALYVADWGSLDPREANGAVYRISFTG